MLRGSKWKTSLNGFLKIRFTGNYEFSIVMNLHVIQSQIIKNGLSGSPELQVLY